MAHTLDEIFHPKSMAVVGASPNNPNPFLGGFKALGFKGNIYAVNPRYTEVTGFKCYPTLMDIPEPVDYVISCVPAALVLGLIDDAVKKGVKVVHFFTAQFSETGRKEAIELEKEVLRRAKQGGVRIIGPNCMGIYHPAWGMGFRPDLPLEAGKVGFISQSGSAAHEVIEIAARRKVFFSKTVSYGNAIDLNETDYLEYLANDPETDIIVLYIEGARNGQKLLEVLKKTVPEKPVIIIKGGRGESGQRTTQSHTGSLAGSMVIWKALFRQTGVVQVADMEELVDMLLVFCLLPPNSGRNAGVVGGSGGVSVIGADLCEEAGLKIVPLSPEFRQELKNSGSSVWDWLGNPVDISIDPNLFKGNGILKLMYDSPDFDVLILVQQLANPQNFTNMLETNGTSPITDFVRANKPNQPGGKPTVVVLLDRGQLEKDESASLWAVLQKAKNAMIDNGVPVFFNIGRAANALSKHSAYYDYKKRVLQ